MLQKPRPFSLMSAPQPNTFFSFSEVGSSLVEMAIALPIFVIFVLGILDFGRVVYRHLLFSEALASSVRQAAVLTPATPSADCLSNLQQSYRDAISPFEIDTTTITFTGSSVTTDSSGQRGINFRVQIPVSCLFFGYNAAFNNSLFIPFEDPNACP